MLKSLLHFRRTLAGAVLAALLSLLTMAGAAGAAGASQAARRPAAGRSAAGRQHSARRTRCRRASRGSAARRRRARGCASRANARVILARATSVGRHRARRAHSARRAVAAATGPLHTETWAYDDCGNGGVNASAAVVAQWTTYAEANCGPGGDAKALGDCHSGATVSCNVVQYLDTNWIYRQGSPPWPSFSAAASESWYQHQPGSQTNRIAIDNYGGGYLVNQMNSGVRSFFQSYVRSNYPAADGLMMDDQSGSLSSQLYSSTCRCSASNEDPQNWNLRFAHEAMNSAMTRPTGQPYLQIDNSLPPNPYLRQGLGLLNSASATRGLISEGEPMSGGNLDPFYSTLLDEIAYVANKTNSFVVPLSYASAGASYQLQSRRVQEGTILLGYSPGHLVDWADLEQGSRDLAIWPEEGIYPTQPVQSMGVPGGTGCLGGIGDVCSSGGHNDLLVAPGVYRREFGACYDHGALFGACATIVNTTAAPVTVSASWLTGAYAHQVTYAGGDVQSGGSVDLTSASFTPGSTIVGAHDSTILAS